MELFFAVSLKLWVLGLRWYFVSMIRGSVECRMLWTNVFCVVHVLFTSDQSKQQLESCPTHLVCATAVVWEYTHCTKTQAILVLQLNRTQTVERAMVCDDEKKLNVESQPQVELKTQRVIDLTWEWAMTSACHTGNYRFQFFIGFAF